MYYLKPFNQKRNQLMKGSDLFDVFFDNFFKDDFTNNLSLGENSMINSFKVDVKDTESEYIIEAELPGVEKENIELSYENKQLSICAKRGETVEENTDNYIRRERRFGSFQRSFYLDNIDEGSINARFENGVLNISIAKKEKAIPETKKIEIK